MQCKYLKQKLNRKLECKLTNKIITFKDCSTCIYKEYNCTFKDTNNAIEQIPDVGKMLSNNYQINKSPVIKEKVHSSVEKSTKFSKNSAKYEKKTPKMSKKSKKLAKMERNRTSILTSDMEHCFVCGAKKEHIHEVCFGKNRLNSIKYGLVIPVCFNCHVKIHEDINLQDKHHRIAQKKFNEVYPYLDFVEIFKRNYLD